MDKDLKLIKAELVVLFMRLDKIERKLNKMATLSAPPSSFAEELEKEARKILDQM